MERKVLYAAQVAALVCVSPAFGAQRTFVASTGSDVNPCTLTAPCRTFQAGIAAVSDGGEVVAVDTAGYGTFVVNKPVSVVVPSGVHAGISVGPMQLGIAVTSTGYVRLAGLAVTGTGGSIGVEVLGGTVAIEGCSIERMADEGVAVVASAQVSLRDSTVRWNGAGGIAVTAPGAQLHVARSRIEFNGGYGLTVSNGATAVVDQSALSNNAGGGVLAALARLVISDSEVDGNHAFGVFSNHSTTTVDRSVVTNNTLAGIGVIAFNAASTATIANSVIAGNLGEGIDVHSYGFSAAATAAAQVSGTTLHHNSGTGVIVHADNTGDASATVSRSTVSQHAVGLAVSTSSGTARLVVNGNTVTGNVWGLSQSLGGILATFGNNDVSGNSGGQVSGVLTPTGGT